MTAIAARRWNFGFLAAAVGLVVVSGMAMASAASMLNPEIAYRHWVWSLAGIIICLAVSFSNHRLWVDAGPILYGVAVCALLLVELMGVTRLGAARWLSLFGISLQPSEIAKLGIVLCLAAYLGNQPAPLPARAVWASLAIAGVPAGLVFAQPDLGSATILMAIWAGMIVAAGASARMLAGLGCLVSVLVPIGWHVLKGYQRDRLLVFLNPNIDPLGAGYTIIQSTIAIGSGGAFGRGWFSGTQNQLSFLPERHSDFIFSVIGEEWGWFGCLVVIGLFAALLSRLIGIGLRAADSRGVLLAAGVFSWLGYQSFVNMGMVMGLLPVVGVPLPLVSYGGSSMVTIWLALGLAQAVHRDSAQ